MAESRDWVSSDSADSNRRILSVGTLDDARRDLRRNLRFAGDLEQHYRQAQDHRHRTPRLIFFAVVASAFALAPFYNDILFAPVPEILPLLLLIELGVGLPLALLGMVSAVTSWEVARRRRANTCAVLGLWASVLALHALGLMGHLYYPQYIVSLSVIGVAVFCAFRTARFVAGSSVVMFLDMVLMLHFLPEGIERTHAVYQMVFFWLVAAASAVSLDFFSRESWLANEYSRALAHVDGLTGLLTRRSFDELYARVVAHAARERRTLAVALVDLDHFKAINDVHGHLVGDEVLVQVGQVIQRNAGHRPLDLQARYGGEEFVLVWYDMDGEALERLLERLHRALGAIAFYGAGDGQLHSVTASIGAIREYPAAGAGSGQGLLSRADELLYRAKALGRDRVLWADQQRERMLRGHVDPEPALPESI